MPERIDLFDAIDTQRGIRYLRPDPVPEELITRLLRAAIKAPSGGVRQGWSFIVIRDQETRRKIGALYRTGTRFEIRPDMTSQERRVYGAAQYLEDHMEDVPVFILACIQADPGTTTSGSSIYPAVQNILLAARGLGLGSVLTTRQMRFEKELKNIHANVKSMKNSHDFFEEPLCDQPGTTGGSTDSTRLCMHFLLPFLWHLLLHFLLQSGRGAGWGEYLWAAMDSAFATGALLLADGVSSPLLLGYPLLVVCSGLWYRVPLVRFVTAAALLSYGVLVLDSQLVRPDLGVAIDRHLIFLVSIVGLGLTTSHMVQHANSLARIYGSVTKNWGGITGGTESNTPGD